MISPARRCAWQALCNMAQRQQYANAALQHVLRSAALSERDKALCTELVYGTVQRQRTLDALLAEHSRRPLTRLEPPVLALLRMTAYQLVFLDRIPAYAAVDDAVELAKQSRPRAAGFVNAVLRAWLRDPRPARARLQELVARTGAWAEQMGLLHSYPTWLVEAWERQFGRARTEAMLISCNQPPVLGVRVNPLRATREQALVRVQTAAGAAAATASPVAPWGLRLHRGLDVEAWDLYREGWVTVQDEGSMLVAPLVSPSPSAVVLDMCAGLGTKATHLAELQADRGQVWACDVYGHKLRNMQTAARRLGLTSLKPLLTDARSLPQRPGWSGRFDAVLLDAPCSGLGVLRRRPDIRWRRTPADLASLQTLQAELLRAAALLVRPGGVVVYATCTLLAEENEVQLAHLLADGVPLRPEDPRPWLPHAVAERIDMCTAGVLLTPEQWQTDGFYMARLRRMDG
ncbi:MAG: 16S rRNA (cytosine(967)-C(5))-methyltransferase RsmB [Alicyclobacillus sp.]|nr:16S rRNA (cytosine(967)-C(5))-methyltransferase RsmB [Alicyclobacillus sp.]